MSDKLGPWELRELGIVIAILNNEPSILNPDFLVRNNIVDADWKQKENPICIGPLSKVVYDNGITITSEQHAVSFTNTQVDKCDGINKLKDVATKYFQQINNVSCIGVGINPVGHIPFDEKNELRGFVERNLIALKEWPHELEGIAIYYRFNISGAILNLRIEEGVLKDSKKPVLIFGGNFHHVVRPDGQLTTSQNVLEIIRECPNDIDTFRKYVQSFIPEAQ